MVVVVVMMGSVESSLEGVAKEESLRFSMTGSGIRPVPCKNNSVMFPKLYTEWYCLQKKCHVWTSHESVHACNGV